MIFPSSADLIGQIEYHHYILFPKVMISKSLEDFERLYQKFKMREQEIPQNLRWKLLYIAEKIHKTNLRPMELTSTQQQQIQDLVNLDPNTLAIIFNFIAKSLLVEKKSQQRQCKIKYPGVFELWKTCRLSTDGKYLIVINQKIIHKYELSLMDISNCRKSKYSFDLYFKSQILIFVKFASPDAFREFLTQLQCAIEQSKEGHSTQSPLSRMEQRYQKQQEKEQIQLKKRSNEVASQQIERGSQQERKQSEIIDEKPNGYQIIQEDENLLICLKEGEPRLYVSLSLTTQCQLEKVVNFYIQQKQWNGYINMEQIKQEDENLFEVYRTFKKQSIIQTQKSVFTNLRVVCSKNSANLLEESIKNDPEGKDEKSQCSMKAITKFYRCLGGTKIIIDSQLKVKGYSNPKYAISILTKLYSDLKFFENSLKISQLQKNKLKNMVSPFVEMRQSRRKGSSRIMEQDPIVKKQNDMPNTNDTLELKPIKQIQDLKYFLKLKPTSPLVIPTLEYIQLVQNKENESCYLSHKLNQNILTKYDNYSPPYIPSEMFKHQYTINNDNLLIYINYDILNGQKDSLKFIIKQIGANLLTGKSVLNVSMPVDIFQSRSLLERNASSFGSAPDYLIPVADADALTQMKNVLTLIATIPTLQLLMQKPFNPIIGQTFTAYLKGIPIYYEQISHHPPISAFYMTCPEFTIHGQLAAFADISINSAVGGNEGVMHIIFRNGNHFQCYFPPCEISGLIFGERTFRAYGKGFILQKKSNLFAQMSIEKPKKGLYQRGDQELTPGDLLGGIFQVTSEFMEEISSHGSLRKFSGLTKKQVIGKLADVRGIWFQDIRINGQIINKNIKVYPLEYPKITLPSDSNYREDILYHKIKDLPQSQKMKEQLQVKQRGDRKLRQKHAKQSKKRL